MNRLSNKRKFCDGLDGSHDENDPDWRPDVDITNNSNANKNCNSNTNQKSIDIIRAGRGWEYFLTEFHAPLQLDDCFHWSSLSYFGDCIIWKLEKLNKQKIIKISSDKASSINVDIVIHLRQTTTNKLKGEKRTKTKDNTKSDVAGDMKRCHGYYSSEYGIICPWRLIPIEGSAADIRNRLVSARTVSDPQNLPILQQMMHNNKKVQHSFSFCATCAFLFFLEF